MKLSDRLREIIERSEFSRYEISKRSGVGQSVLSKFMQGTHVTTDTLDRLADVLELDLIVRTKRNTKKAR